MFGTLAFQKTNLLFASNNINQRNTVVEANTVEHLAKIGLAAQQLGGARPLPISEVDALSKKGRPKSDPPRERAEQGDIAPAVAPAPAPKVQVGQLVEDALKRYQ